MPCSHIWNKTSAAGCLSQLNAIRELSSLGDHLECVRGVRAAPSHLSVALDEDGEPEKLRFVYVDEHSCIGCTYCTQVARSTFMLEPDNGRARVFSQVMGPPRAVKHSA